MIIDYENGKYIGSMNSDMEKNGFGKYIFDDGDEYYEGDWVKDQKEGLITFYLF